LSSEFRTAGHRFEAPGSDARRGRIGHPIFSRFHPFNVDREDGGLHPGGEKSFGGRGKRLAYADDRRSECVEGHQVTSSFRGNWPHCALGNDVLPASEYADSFRTSNTNPRNGLDGQGFQLTFGPARGA
jgi:hypothetical protein